MWLKYKKLLVTIHNKNDISTIVLNYIKQKKMILYGGLAIDILVRSKSKGREWVYNKETDVPDYDVYSRNYEKDSIVLANMLRDKYKYKKIRIGGGMLASTKKIWVELSPLSVIDISQMRDDYDNLDPTLHDGILVASPQYLKIDQYQNLSTNLFVDFYRFEKVFSRVLLLEKYFPVRYEKKFDSPSLQIKKININLDDKEYILCGNYVWNMYYNGDKDNENNEKIILSNDVWDEEIPEDGVYTNEGLLLPINGATFYNMWMGEKIATKALLLYIYYYFRFHHRTNKYDHQITRILEDETVFSIYTNDNIKYPKILVPTKDKIIMRKKYSPTVYLD